MLEILMSLSEASTMYKFYLLALDCERMRQESAREEWCISRPRRMLFSCSEEV